MNTTIYLRVKDEIPKVVEAARSLAYARPEEKNHRQDLLDEAILAYMRERRKA